MPPLYDLAQCGEKASDFFGSVVVGEADAEKAAVFFYVQALGEIQGVVISIPSKESAISQFRSEFKRRVSRDADHNRRAAFGEAGRIGDSVELEAGNFQQSLNEFLHQAALMLLDRVKSSDNRGTAGSGGWVHVTAETGQVLHAGCNSSNTFVVERAPLPAIGDGVGVGANFVRLQALEVFALAEEHAHVWAE